MSNHKYAAEFREEAVRQVLERGYSVKEVADNLGVSRHSLYKWVREAKPSPHQQKEEELLEAKREVLKLRAELRRAQEERDILSTHLSKRTARSTASRRCAGCSAWRAVGSTPGFIGRCRIERGRTAVCSSSFAPLGLRAAVSMAAPASGAIFANRAFGGA